jgi:nucleoside-diphosphate-sugar epimerase
MVAVDNLYMYGPTDGQPLTEDLPYAATTRKGSVRAQMATGLLAADESGKLRVTVGRASDYFGPRGLLTAMGERVFYPALAGKKARVLGDPDQLHSYTYLPDIARGLIVLGEREEADGKAWHLPNARAVTTRQFIEMVFAAAGTEPGIQAMPRFMVSAVGLFNGNVRELKEMLYEFEEPFVVDSTRFEAAFGSEATPLPEAIETTVDWFRSHPQKA